MNQDNQEKPLHFELKKKPDIEINVGGVPHYFYLIPPDKMTLERQQEYVNGLQIIESGLTSIQLDTALDMMYQICSDKNKKEENKVEDIKGFIANLQTRRGMMNTDTFITAMTCFLVAENESILDWNLYEAKRKSSILLMDIQSVFFCAKRFTKLYKPFKSLPTDKMEKLIQQEILLSQSQKIIL
jgi:hypothetical protein